MALTKKELEKVLIMREIDMKFGKYIFKDDKSDKFWTIVRSDVNEVTASWGKNGRSPQGSKEYTDLEALHKLNEKISKGYHLSSEKIDFENFELEEIEEKEDEWKFFNVDAALRKIK